MTPETSRTSIEESAKRLDLVRFALNKCLEENSHLSDSDRQDCQQASTDVSVALEAIARAQPVVERLL